MTDGIIIKKNQWYKRKWVYVALIFCLVVFGVVYSKVTKKIVSQYEFAKVTKGDLVQTVDATGNIESANELDLKFAISGRLSKINKPAGAEVKAGEVLAQLELGDLNAAVAQASAGVAKAQADLNKILAGDTLEYKASLEAALNQAKANLNQIKASSDNSVHVAEAALETAQNNLQVASGGEESQIVKDAYDDMVSLLQTIPGALSSALTEADNILGVDNVSANDDFEDVLSALNTSKLSAAQSQYLIAKQAKTLFEMYKDISTNDTHEHIDKVAVQAEAVLGKVKDLLFFVSGALDYTSAIGDLSQAELDTLKTNINTQRTGISTKFTAIITQKQAIVTAKNSYVSYSIAYQKAQNDLVDTKAAATADVASYEAAVAKAQATFDDSKNPPRDVDVASYKASVSSARASLAQAVANRSKAIIVAPVSGVVGKIAPKVGEYVTPQDEVIKLVSQMYQVKVDIPETDIIKMSLGDVAEIKLDAYGDDVKFTGKVVQIEPGQTVIQDVVYYRVTVSLEPDKTHQIFNGMTANIVFSTEEKTGVLVLPQKAIKTNGGKYVRVLENGELKEVLVKVGLRGDGGQVEILEGLTEGQEVVVSVTEAK